MAPVTNDNMAKPTKVYFHRSVGVLQKGFAREEKQRKQHHREPSTPSSVLKTYPDREYAQLHREQLSNRILPETL